MVTNQIMLTSAGAAVLVSTSTEELLACPHCDVGIVLEEIGTEPECGAITCPHCEQKSLLVRLVSVLHRAVRWPADVLTQLQAETSRAAAVSMPDEIFTLSVSRGAVVLLAMLWHRAERAGSRTIESSVTQLAQRQLSTRAMVRRWLAELVEVGALHEVTSADGKRGKRQWELLPLASKEASDAG